MAYDILAFILPNRVVGGFVWGLFMRQAFCPIPGPFLVFEPFGAGVCLTVLVTACGTLVSSCFG